MAHQSRPRGDSLLDESENPPKRRRQEEASEEDHSTLLAQIHAEVKATLSDMTSTDFKSDHDKMHATLVSISSRLDAFEQHRSSDDKSKNSFMMVECRDTTATAALSLPSNEATRDEDEGVLSPLFPVPFVGPAGTALQMVPVPELIHRARQVSPTWRNFLRPDNKRFWKDVAMNNYSSVLSDTAIFSGMSKEEQKRFDFYNFVAGMAQKPNLPPPVPERRLRIEDLVLAIELYRTRDGDIEVHEKVGTFCCTDCSSWLRADADGDYLLRLEQDPDDPFILDFLNPLSRKAKSLADQDADLRLYRQEWNDFHNSRRTRQTPLSSLHTPLRYAAQRQRFSVRAVLFRRDDWRSICLTNTEDDEEPVIVVRHRHYRYYFHDESFPSFAGNHYGAAARELLDLDSDESTNYCFISLGLAPVMPARESSNEAKWQKEFRKRSVNDMDWNETDKAEIATISHFQFRFSSITVNLLREGDDFRKAVSTDGDFARVLEGMEWRKYS